MREAQGRSVEDIEKQKRRSGALIGASNGCCKRSWLKTTRRGSRSPAAGSSIGSTCSQIASIVLDFIWMSITRTACGLESRRGRGLRGSFPARGQRQPMRGSCRAPHIAVPGGDSLALERSGNCLVKEALNGVDVGLGARNLLGAGLALGHSLNFHKGGRWQPSVERDGASTCVLHSRKCWHTTPRLSWRGLTWRHGSGSRRR